MKVVKNLGELVASTAKNKNSIVKLELNAPEKVENISAFKKALKKLCIMFSMNDTGVGYYRYVVHVPEHAQGDMCVLFGSDKMLVQLFDADISASNFKMDGVTFPLTVSILTQTEFNKEIEGEEAAQKNEKPKRTIRKTKRVTKNEDKESKDTNKEDKEEEKEINKHD